MQGRALPLPHVTSLDPDTHQHATIPSACVSLSTCDCTTARSYDRFTGPSSFYCLLVSFYLTVILNPFFLTFFTDPACYVPCSPVQLSYVVFLCVSCLVIMLFFTSLVFLSVLSFFRCDCLPVCLPVCLSVYLSVCLVGRSVCLSVCPSLRLIATVSVDVAS